MSGFGENYAGQESVFEPSEHDRVEAAQADRVSPRWVRCSLEGVVSTVPLLQPDDPEKVARLLAAQGLTLEHLKPVGRRIPKEYFEGHDRPEADES